jgi:hypothetical protein
MKNETGLEGCRERENKTQWWRKKEGKRKRECET